MRSCTLQLLPYLAVYTITLVNVWAPVQCIENPQTAIPTAAIWFDPCCIHCTIAETGPADCKHVLAVHKGVYIFAFVTERPHACTHCCGNSL